MSTNPAEEVESGEAVVIQAEEAVQTVTAARVTHTATIMVVDDDADVRATIASILTSFGLGVVEASDGNDALERMKQRTPDLLITDIQMPRMNGYQLMMHTRNRWPGLPIVLISGYAHTESAMAGRKSPGIDYLEKPFNLSDLITLVLRKLAKQSTGEGA